MQRLAEPAQKVSQSLLPPAEEKIVKAPFKTIREQAIANVLARNNVEFHYELDFGIVKSDFWILNKTIFGKYIIIEDHNPNDEGKLTKLGHMAWGYKMHSIVVGGIHPTEVRQRNMLSQRHPVSEYWYVHTSNDKQEDGLLTHKEGQEKLEECESKLQYYINRISRKWVSQPTKESYELHQVRREPYLNLPDIGMVRLIR